MKYLMNLLTLLFLVLVAGSFHACEKSSPDTTGKGKLEIAVAQITDESLLKSAFNDTSDNNTPVNDTVLYSHHILITVVNEEGTPVLDDEMIPLYNFGSGFISQKIELEAGYYMITKFMVINPEGIVILAAPVEGSPKCYLVNKCLPLGFAVSAGETTRVFPEVLPVLDESPEEFGYAAFGFQIVKPLPFYVLAVVEYDNQDIMPPVSPTEALLTVYAPNGWQHKFKLEAKVNRLVIRGGSDHYILVGEKEGFPPVKLRRTARELLASTPDNPVVLRFVKPSLLVLKPGPEEGKDAMISNLDPEKNFGDHPYFEATFLSESVLTVMRTNRSLIWFDLNELPKSARIHRVILTLFYDKPMEHDYTGGESPVNSVTPWYGAVLQQIVEPWEEHEVTWDKQPKTIETNQVYITPFVSDVHRIHIDVTRLYAPEVAVDMPHYGMYFRLYPTEQFPGFRFASSDHPEPALHPELRIFYTLP